MDGRIDLDHYRGRSCYAMLVQAAEDAIRRHWDLTGIGDLVLTGRKAVGHGEIVTRWAGLVGTYLARVRAVPAEPPRPLTCHSAGVSRPPAYEVVELRAESAA